MTRPALLTATLLAAALAGCQTPKAGAGTPAPAVCAAGGAQMARVELIFGQNVFGGTGISEDEWYDFLSKEVTPRFPDGLTAYDAYGQWKHPDKGVVRLTSKVLVIWYAPSAKAEADIEAIRDAYKRLFKQISVMRVDGLDCVSF
ncbi:hypothetical protein sos41_40990 [Alphaproteobacteria bacterium SO-S41]|nr:hypothetical protein sos41_40990 [Alphaproteobacteria bacterium SO-S41]